MKLLTVVVPCYNEEEAIPFFYEEMEKIMVLFSEKWPEITFEYLFIDDGSIDNTLYTVKKLRTKDEKVRYVSFSRNFGKEAGIYAGLEKAKGDFVVIMDVDLQDPPKLLPEMFQAIYEEGYDSSAT